MRYFLFLFLFFIFSFLAALQHMELPGQGSDLSHTHDLSYSWGNAGSLIYCFRLRVEPVTQCSQDATNPLHHSGNSRWGFFLIVKPIWYLQKIFFFFNDERRRWKHKKERAVLFTSNKSKVSMFKAKRNKAQGGTLCFSKAQFPVRFWRSALGEVEASWPPRSAVGERLRRAIGPMNIKNTLGFTVRGSIFLSQPSVSSPSLVS